MRKRPSEGILDHYRVRYGAAKKRVKKHEILEEFCKHYDYHRKSACRVLNGVTKDRYGKRAGRRKQYDSPILLEVLKQIWLATDQICSKKLKVALKAWLPHYEQRYGEVANKIRLDLLRISASSIDRLLKPCRAGVLKKRFCTTKPGTLIKAKIPIKAEVWQVDRPGFVEGDTVAHCGTSLAGDFVWTLTVTDIESLWTENRATFGKGSGGVIEAMKDIEDHLPFILIGFDSDNGSEFLNYHLIDYFQKRPADKQVYFTRSRPYQKNDNAHVEQKNWTHVRQLYGYVRLDHPAVVELMNDLYRNEWSLLQNYFIPSMKLKSKEKVKSKYRKKYDDPKTPYERLQNHLQIDAQTKILLETQYKKLNPFILRQDIEKKLKRIMQYAKHPGRVRVKI